MDDDELHISRIPTAWSMVRDAHRDHTAVQLAQQTVARPLRRGRPPVRPFGPSQRRRRRRSLSGIRTQVRPRRLWQRQSRARPVSRVCENDRLPVDRRLPASLEKARPRGAHALEYRGAGDRRRGSERRRCAVSNQLARRTAGPLLAETGRRRTRVGKAVPQRAALSGRPSRFAFARVGGRAQQAAWQRRSMPERFGSCCTARASSLAKCCSTRLPNRLRAARSTMRSRS